MVAEEVQTGVQGERAARFWDNFYQKGAAPEQEENSPVHNGQSEERLPGHTEWLVEPCVLIPALVRSLATSRLLQESRSALEETTPFRAVELGCGDSTLSMHLYDQLLCTTSWSSSVEVLGVDISQAGVDKARGRSGAGSTRLGLDFIVGDATDLRGFLSDGVADLVIDKGMSDTLQFRARSSETRALRLRFFSEVFRVLRPGGLYALITPKERARYVRSLPWATVEHECLNPDGCSVGLLAHRGDDDAGSKESHIYLHICQKPLEISATISEKLKSEQASPPGLLPPHSTLRPHFAFASVSSGKACCIRQHAHNLLVNDQLDVVCFTVQHRLLNMRW